jgi:hypothetical protein
MTQRGGKDLEDFLVKHDSFFVRDE